MRLIKVLLSLMLSLLALAYATQNVANLDQMYASVAYVLEGADHEAYPASFFPKPTAPVLVWTTMGIILFFEYLTGLVLLFGSFRMLAAMREGVMGFDQAKKTTLVGAGLGMLTWFGLFHVLGGAVFQQWQTQIGDGSLQGAFWFGGMMALTALFISLTPDS